MHLLPDTVRAENAGLYAGILSSAFMVGRLLTAYQWGRLADTYGRVVVLQTVLTWSAVFSLLFGTSTSFAHALAWRFGLGAVNGILSTCKTAAQEIGHGNAVLERRAMGLVIGMRSWSMLASPALAGFLAEPLQQYAGPFWVEALPTSWPTVYGVLEAYPFLLPNLLVAIMCVLSALAVRTLVPETLAERRYVWADVCAWWRRPWHPQQESLTTTMTTTTRPTNRSWNHSHRVEPQSVTAQEEHKPLLQSEKTNATVTAARDNHDDQTGNEDKADGAPQPSQSPLSVWQRPLTRQHIVLHWLFSFVATYIDEAFPLFCLSGLYLTEAAIGQILSGAGVLFAALQYVSFATLTHHLGLYKSLLLGCCVGTLPVALLPIMQYFVQRDGQSLETATLAVAVTSTSPSSLTLALLLTGSLCMGVTKIMHSLFFVSMAVAVNKTVESHQRAKMNALSLTGNSFVKTGGPMLAGLLVTLCFSTTAGQVLPIETRYYGGWIVFGIVPIMGLLVATRVLALERSVHEANRSKDDGCKNDKPSV